MNGMAAIANPIVNSYKRLKPGYHAPTELFWSLNDYRAPIRVVKGKEGDTHIEWTLPDGAANSVSSDCDGCRVRPERDSGKDDSTESG